MDTKNLTVSTGKRILSECNDLKRTPEALANEISIDVKKVKKILKGDCKIDESYDLINRMGKVYSIDTSDLYLIKSDCEKSIKIKRSSNSKKSSRVFKRLDKNGLRSNYYEYRDTAMSNLSPYKPEWIKQLRIVNDSNPNNPDVIYNNGHFMHQTTFFVGPVNFYWEVNGKKFCREMSTGDSNYITPYWPHSFASRDINEEAYILAITFGGKVRYAQKEFYALGNRSKNFVLEYRNNKKAICQLVKQHIKDENMTLDNLNVLAKKNKLDSNLKKKIKEYENLSSSDIKFISEVLNIEISDLTLPNYNYEEEVVILPKQKKEKYFYPNDKSKFYEIRQLARTSKMPQLKSFDFRIINHKKEYNLSTSLHSYFYNYGNSKILFHWKHNGRNYENYLESGDSLYIQPFISHGFSSENSNGKIYNVRIPGSIDISTQKELSYMANIERVFNEEKSWFD